MDSSVDQLLSRAESLANQFDREKRTTKRDIDSAIGLDREALELCPPGHYMRSWTLTQLSIHLSARYMQFGEIEDIEEAIGLDREALSLRRRGHPDRIVSLNSLAFVLTIRYEKFGALPDLEEAIALGREALTLFPQGHPDCSLSLNNLGIRLITRYERFGAVSDLDEAIALGREALTLLPQGHPDRSISLDNLGIRLSARYQKFGAVSDLDEAIALGREALTLRPQGHPNRSISLDNLGVRLSVHYHKFGAVSDLDEAIALGREALTLFPQGHPNRSLSLNNLGIHFTTRYERFGAVSDLDEAITLGREALTLRPQGHPDRSISLDNLGVRLSVRYHKFGTVSDLDEAIALGREALTLFPQGHPNRSLSLNNLGIHLTTRYEGFGVVSDLDEAITLGREALTLRPQGHPDRSISLDNLGVRLSARYHKFGTVSDLDEAIALGQEALTLFPQGHPNRSLSLNNLGFHLTTRYERFGAVSDLDEGIDLGQEALTLCPQGHPSRSMSLNNLAARLYMSYQKSGAIYTLDEVITLNREALSLRPQGHPDRSISLINLGIYLSTRYGKLDMISDLNEAIILGQEALELQTQGQPTRWKSLKSLATWLLCRYNKLGVDHDFNTLSNDLEEAFRLYTQFSNVSYTVSSGDLGGCREWIRAAEYFGHSSTRLAYETSLRLLVEHLFLLPSLPQHLVVLKEHTASLAVDAFSACLRNHASERAVELLEQGRSVFWNQLIRLHSPLDDVVASGPAGETLAKRFTDLTILIREALHSADKSQHDHIYHLNIEIQSVVTAIRELPGLSRFLLPSLFSDLRRAAREGPVIIVNASQYGCDALIVTHNHDPVHIPLSITRAYVKVLSSRFLGLPRRGSTRDVTHIVGVILRELWEDVVRHVVCALQKIRPTVSRRIWWCPTAEFSDLPLHAAGPYRRGQKNLPDLYISSYTPTLSALIRARRTRTSESAGDMKRFIAIGQAKAVGERELLSVSAELTKIGEDVRGAATFKQIEGEGSRISLVTEELVKSEWVHLACHGLPNRTEPFKSAFALRDGHFTIEQIIRCELDNPEFAYLSACRTTVGDEESPDESIHLASAMQYLGFRSVIGTMWSVDDSVTNTITSRFYKHILDPESGRLDYTRAAFALNETMRTISSSEITLDQRVLYIHLGA